MRKIIALMLLIGIFLTPVAFAGESVWEMAQSEKYGTKAGGMFGRGLVNVATCFMDIIVQTVNGTQDGPPFVGTMTGLGGGLGCTALRVTSGALDVLTFWVPDFNGIPVSRSYDNCLESDYVASTSEGGNYAAPIAQKAAPAVYEQVPAAKTSSASDYVKK